MKFFETVFQLLSGSLIECPANKTTPSSDYFLTHLTPIYVIAIIFACILCVTTLALGIMHTLYVFIYVTHPDRRAFVLFLAGTAPFVSCFSLVAMFMPRIWFLAHLLSFFYFSIALYFTTPSSDYFLTHLTPIYVIAIIFACILCVTTLALGIMHTLYVFIYVTHPDRRAFVLFLAGTAPFVSCFSLVAMFMPRIWFLAHLLSFFYFSIALYFVICLLMHIVEGRQSMVKKMHQKSSRMTVQTPPFCCVFPCLPTLQVETRKIKILELMVLQTPCVRLFATIVSLILMTVQTPPFCCVFPCLPTLQVETRKIKILELMVLQTPCVRLFATIVSLILYFEYSNDAMIALKVLDFISLPSLLFGIYGCHILVTTVSKLDELIPYRYIVVFRLLDIYFAFFGLQQPIFDFLARAGIFGCGTLLSAIDTAFFWKNFATVLESFFVSVISTSLLKPSRSALFDKYPSTLTCSVTSGSTHESTA
uniref:Uncharacterized protein n=1 Tax=Panagrolaimus sp. JU765 TaxID=591449 RepID=A0AC34QL40_9BILA